MKKLETITIFSILLFVSFFYSCFYVKPVMGTVFFQNSFANGFSNWNGVMTGGEWTSPVISSTVAFDDQYSLEALPTAHSEAVYKIFNTSTPSLNVREYVYFSNLPSIPISTADPATIPAGVVTIMTLMSWNIYSNLVNAGIYNDNGVVKWLIDSIPSYPDPASPSKPRALASAGPVANEWYYVELGVSRTGTTYTCTLYAAPASSLTIQIAEQTVLTYTFTASALNFNSIIVGGYDKTILNNIAVYNDAVVAADTYVGPLPSSSVSPSGQPNWLELSAIPILAVAVAVTVLFVLHKKHKI